MNVEYRANGFKLQTAVVYGGSMLVLFFGTMHCFETFFWSSPFDHQ